MSKLTLTDVADLIMGQSPPSSTYNEMGNGLPFLQGKAEFGRISPNPIKYCSSPNKRAPSNSILMSVRAPVGDVNMADQEYAIGRGLASIVPKKYDLWYLYFYLYSQKGRLDALASGTTFKSINKTVLSTFPIPECYPENQRAIGIVLCAIQNAKETREAELALERERKAALMAYLFTHGTRGEALKQTEIGEMPKSWNASLLKSCAEKPEYGYTESANNNPVGPKFLRITDIQDGSVDWNNVPYCVCDERTFTKKKLIKDDLVIARIGATTGKTFYISDCPDQSVYASYLIRVRAQKNVMHPKYFAHFAETPLYWGHINKNKGGKLKGGVNIPILQAMKLPLGSLEEQKEIVDILDAQEKKIRALIQEMKVLNELFHSLLDELMSGKLSAEPLLEPKKNIKKKVVA